MSGEHDALRPSSRRKREAILAAAERQFLAEGYEAVTMDSIAAESEVAKQTLYRHFGSKRALFLELVTTQTAAAGARVHAERPRIDDRTDVRALLTERMETQLATVLAPGLLSLRRLVIGEQGRFPELAAALYENGPGHAIDVLAGILRELDANGLLRVPEPAAAATQLNWLVMGEPVNAAMLLGEDAAPSPVEQRRHVARALDVFLAGHAQGDAGSP